jgi:hypothetical protein
VFHNLVFSEMVVNDATSIVPFNIIHNFDLTYIYGSTSLQLFGNIVYFFLISTVWLFGAVIYHRYQIGEFVSLDYLFDGFAYNIYIITCWVTIMKS